MLTALRISLMGDAPQTRFETSGRVASRERPWGSGAVRSPAMSRSASEESHLRKADSTQDMQRFAEQCERVRTKMRTTHEESRNELDAISRYIRNRQQNIGGAFLEFEEKIQREDFIKKYELDRLIARHHNVLAPPQVLEEFLHPPARSKEEDTILQLEEETGENVFRIERAFKYFKANDTDNSGFLDADELKLVLSQLHNGIEPSRGCMLRAMAELDRDGDGEVSFHEFFIWYFNEFINDSVEKDQRKAGRKVRNFSRQQWTPDWLLRSTDKLA